MKTTTTTTSTFTTFKGKYSENRREDSIMEYVRHASSDEDALHNLRVELKKYKKEIIRNITVKELIKLFFKKL